MGTVLAVMFAAFITSSLCTLRSRWAARDIHVSSTIFLYAVLVASITAAGTGVWFGPFQGATAGVFAGVATVTSYTDITVQRVPSGAVWLGVLAGGGILVTGVWLGFLGSNEAWSASALLVVAALMAMVAVVSGGFGGGDVRFLVLVAATMWWLSLPAVLAGFLFAHFFAFFHALRNKTGVPLVPFLTGGLVVALVVTAVFLK